MRKIILVAHTTVDGFVAGENGDFDAFRQSPENLDFVCSLTDQSDALLAGRVSFQMLDTYWPKAFSNPGASKSEIRYSEWYNSATKIVLSRSLNGKTTGNVSVLSEDAGQRLKEIKNGKGRTILMFGSPTAHQLLRGLGLIDEYWLLVYPVLLGKGIPLFTPAQGATNMTLLESRVLSLGEVALHYKVEAG